MKGSRDLAGYPFVPRRIGVSGGYRMAWVDEGEGPLIVCLHGNPSWSYLYRNLILALRDRYRILAPDHLGCGFSDKPQDYPYRLAGHIDNLSVLLDHLDVRRCLLVMHDWGGAIGMGWAGRCPERVAGLVVSNTAAFRSRCLPLRIRLCRLPLIGALLVRGANGFARAAVSMAVQKKMDPEVARSFLRPYDSWANRIALHRFVQDIPMHPRHPSWETLVAIEKGLTGLRDKPLMLCWGGADFCFTGQFLAEWQKRFPAAESHLFPDAGHYLLEDEAEAVTALVDRFASRCLS